MGSRSSWVYTQVKKGAITSLGYDSDSLIVVLVQFASLIMNKKKVSMSTRKGLFKTLEELIKDVGVDATRFFYLMRKADQTLEFDIDLAKEESSKILFFTFNMLMPDYRVLSGSPVLVKKK